MSVCNLHCKYIDSRIIINCANSISYFYICCIFVSSGKVTLVLNVLKEMQNVKDKQSALNIEEFALCRIIYKLNSQLRSEKTLQFLKRVWIMFTMLNLYLWITCNYCFIFHISLLLLLIFNVMSYITYHNLNVRLIHFYLM